MALILACMVFYACRDSNNVSPNSQLQGGFDYRSTQDVTMSAAFMDSQGKYLTQVPFVIATSRSFDSTSVIASVSTGTSGHNQLSFNIPTTTDTVFVRVGYHGIPTRWKVPVGSGQINWDLATPFNEPVANTKMTSTGGRADATLYKINYLGTWDGAGRPNYCLPVGDNIGSDLLSRLYASLPEAVDLRKTHPEYIDSIDKSVEITQDADVWITFISEGAGYLNSLLYYIYDKNSPPSTVADLSSVNVIFPNASFGGSGGGMRSGDKVYLGKFKAGQMIGWLLFSNGYNYSSQQVTLGNWDLHSNQALNSFIADPSLRQQNVLLKDPVTGLAILGFEDIRRDYGTDNDFNDVLFSVSSNPATAVNTQVLSILTKPIDADGDGVTDNLDAYPNDAARAYNQYFPAQNSFNTLAYEDLWPSRGDYDFNDLVIAYNAQQVLNASNNVVDVKMTYQIQAVGGINNIGFAVQLPVPSTNLKQCVVTPAYSGNSVIANGVETGQSKLVIPLFDDAHIAMKAPIGYLVNTVEGVSYINPQTSTVSLTFANPVSQSQLGTAPYNSFIYVNHRSMEVHLPNLAPTDKADVSQFGQHADRSKPAQGVYYLTYDDKPWGLLIPGTFNYPAEKQSIETVYTHFVPWAVSKGSQYKDWYSNSSGYRNSSEIYQH